MSNVVKSVRVSAESLTQAASGRRVVPIGFTKEAVLLAAVKKALEFAPEGEERDALAKEFQNALKANELCISFGLSNGVVNPNDWMVTSGHPDVVERPVILGGVNKTPAMGRNGLSYMKVTPRVNYSIINGCLAALGITRAPRAPAPVYGGFQFGTPPGAPAGAQPQDETQEQDVSGADDFPV